MAIEKRKLFEQTRKRWPLSVRVFPADGIGSFETTPSIVDLYREIQESCDPPGEWTSEDEWTGLANWSFYQALGKLAEQSHSERDIRLEEVNLEMFDEQMRSNLAHDCWSAERHEYEESPGRFH